MLYIAGRVAFFISFAAGNLKPKNLYGQVVNSQMYNTGDNDEGEDQRKADPEVCADNSNQGGDDKSITERKYACCNIVLHIYFFCIKHAPF